MSGIGSKILKAFRRPIHTLRRNFFSGVVVVIPLIVAGWLIVIGFDLVKSSYVLVPSWMRPPEDMVMWFQMIIYAGLLFLAVFLMSLLGWLSKLYLGKKILKSLRLLLQKIPILGTIYSALDQLLNTFGAGGQNQFRRVVYVEYPRREMWTVAFVTGESKSTTLPEGHLNLFIPTVPNPTSGFLLIVPEKDVRESKMSVEEAFKKILSLGIADEGARQE